MNLDALLSLSQKRLNIKHPAGDDAAARVERIQRVDAELGGLLQGYIEILKDWKSASQRLNEGAVKHDLTTADKDRVIDCSAAAQAAKAKIVGYLRTL